LDTRPASRSCQFNMPQHGNGLSMTAYLLLV
jgi:hypothetical protein